MQFLRADANFGSQAELSTVGKGGRYVDVNTGGINPFAKEFGLLRVFADYGLTVSGRIKGNVLDGFFCGIYRFDGHFIIEELCAVMFFAGR